MAPVVGRVFVSHSYHDNDFAIRLVQGLRHMLGDEDAVFIADAQGGLHGGDRWWKKIIEELTAREVFLLILSPDSMGSDWVLREIDTALVEYKKIIPILYRACTIRPDLKIYQIISFLAPKPYEAAFQEVLDALAPPRQTPVAGKERTNLSTNYTIPPTAQMMKVPITDQNPSLAPQETRERWINEAISLYNHGRYDQAIVACDRVLFLDPKDALAHRYRAIALIELKRYEEAIVACDQVIRLDLYDSAAYGVKATVLIELKRYEEALVACDQVIFLEPYNPVAYRKKSAALFRLMRYREAIVAYIKAITHGSEY